MMDAFNVREKYEWSKFWWNNADDISLRRVLLIGDSISVGYRPVVTELLADKANVDLMANSKGICDTAFKKELKYILGEYSYQVIHLNNGLHAVRMTDEQYQSSLQDCIETIKLLAPHAKIIWASSTPITKIEDSSILDEKNEQVVRRNQIAAEIMKKNSIPVNDLYNLVLGKESLRLSDDGYHYNDEGRNVQGYAVAQAIQQVMEV